MKIAVCFSGQIRTGLETAETFFTYLGNFLECSDFFIHTWDVESVSFQDTTVPQEKRGKHNPLDFSKLGRIVEIYKPKALEVSNLYQVLERENKKAYKVQANPMFYSLWRSNELKKASELEWSMKYDYVIRTRFDLSFGEDSSLEEDLNRHKGISIIDPSNVIDHAFEDQFWIASSPIMDELANFYHTLMKTEYDALAWQIHQKQVITATLGLPITIIPSNIWIRR